jgi:MoaA/NifB/PqqE/SkfB family radical SAM enzyme
MVFRNRPYFAHLALTHRCNLRCRFCHIPEEPVPEQDTEGMKRIIDRLDRMGIAVLSISGGGEPLLRSDVTELLNYAAAKGLYTKITSNGTVGRDKYAELLASGISEISISLDGVSGNDLPFSHNGPKILETIRYLNDNLPQGKSLTLNVTVSSSNRDQLDEIVAYCTREFPKARIWLNPVVVGEGKLRVPTQLKVNPDYLRRVDSPTVLTPGFYKQACEEYYWNETYNWGCLAGEFFFDIKPNGDLWICQDHPAKTPLNILDPDFDGKYAREDFSHRRQCGGCTYSCYLVTQKSFEPRTWPGMAGIWWKSRTQPDEPCRETAVKYGWLAGLLHFSAARGLKAVQAATGLTLWTALLATVLLGNHLVGGEPPSSPPSAPEIVARMEQCNARRAEALSSYTSLRRYSAANQGLHRDAYVVAETRYKAAEGKQIRVIERGGSPSIDRRVFAPMIETELANSRSPAREATDISTRNYTFTYEGYDEAVDAHIFRVEPRARSRYLFRGIVWINANDFAVQRIEGEPAQKHSFWIRKTRFVHEYGKFGAFWFPVSNRTEVELKLFGRSTMSIDYFDYEWQPHQAVGCATPASPIRELPLRAVAANSLTP